MVIIKITSQDEWNALPDQFAKWTHIQIIAAEKIVVNRRIGNSSVEARDNSSVAARDNSSVVAWDNSSVEARDNSSVAARDNSSVEARDNSSVEARDNSSVLAWNNSSVVACDNSSVVARDNSSVEAWGNSSVLAWDQCVARYFSSSASLSSNGQAVIFQYVSPDKAAILTGKAIVRVKSPASKTAWLSAHGLVAQGGSVILFKRVSSEFKTQENTANETVWAVGSFHSHPNWDPKKEECGGGKFHACPKTYFCDDFRQSKGDRYVAIRIAVKDLYVWGKNPSFPHKIAFRAGTVVYECDKKGNQIG